MRCLFVVNDRRTLGVEQTTTALVGAAVRRGHDVTVASVGDVFASPSGELTSVAARVGVVDEAEVVDAASSTRTSTLGLDDLDVCVIRTNPARDEARASLHAATLQLLELLAERGCRVINQPRGLSRAASKLSLFLLPERLRPRTLVTRNSDDILQFVREEGRAVIKPLEGTRGRDVFVLQSPSSEANVHQIVDVVLRQGYAVVQEFVEGAEDGDVRVTVVDGEILTVDGEEAAVARVPAAADFRSNLHAGGSVRAAMVSDAMREAVEALAPVLLREGLRHVGIDFVGHRILELNVFSPGGLVPSRRLYDRDFASAVIASFERPS
jgi:glutathione synthase